MNDLSRRMRWRAFNKAYNTIMEDRARLDEAIDAAVDEALDTCHRMVVRSMDGMNRVGDYNNGYYSALRDTARSIDSLIREVRSVPQGDA